MSQRRSSLNSLRSIFVELLGWADDAGPLPFSLVVAGILLGLFLLAVGITLFVLNGYVVLSMTVALIGAGLLFGTMASRPS